MAWNESATKGFSARPLSFMANAMVLAPTFAAADVHNRAQPLVLAPAGNPMWSARIRKPDGGTRACPLYQITRARDGETGFMAYIADFEQGRTVQTTLGTEANLCFTVNMNGCTFGMGSQSPVNPGVCVVSHGNAANNRANVNFDSNAVGAAGGTALQTAIQFSRARELHGDTGRAFEPEHYRTDGKMSVTFCLREPAGAWKLYFLSYTREGGGVYTSYGVSEAPTNSLAL